MNLSKDFSLNKRLESDTVFIDDLTLCKFLLMNDSNYYWFLLVPRINNIKELYDLSQKDRIQLDFETVEVAKFI
jgi:diadenosine tetraphosphate (Ap4A) HIT family hydrolase